MDKLNLYFEGQFFLYFFGFLVGSGNIKNLTNSTQASLIGPMVVRAKCHRRNSFDIQTSPPIIPQTPNQQQQKTYRYRSRCQTTIVEKIYLEAKMTNDILNDKNVPIEVPSGSGSSSIVGWEDIAIVIKDTQNSTTNDISKSIESSLHPHQYVDPSKVGDGIQHPLKSDMQYKNVTMPKSIPVGSSDDSCCSDSTESSAISTCSGNGGDSRIGTDTNIDPNSLLEKIDVRRNESSEFVLQERIQNDTLSTKPKVQFSTVQVRDYAIVLGDHPYCEMYPLSLDWNYVEILTTTMDDFEENHRRRIPNENKVFSPVVARKIIKKGKGMSNMVNVRARKLSVMERMSLLIEFTGYTSQQLYQLERKRQLLVQDEKLLSGINASLALI